MLKQSCTVQNLLGLHVKPAKLIAQAASQYSCEIILTLRDKSGSAKSMVDILKLGVKCGDTVTLVTTGADEAEALQEIGSMLSRGIEAADKPAG